MYFKVLRSGRSCNGGTYRWDLPKDGKPGAWSIRIDGRLIPCKTGYHLAENDQLFKWVGVPCQVYIAEVKFRVVHTPEKVVAHTVRLVKELKVSEKQYRAIIDEMWDYLGSNEESFRRLRLLHQYEEANDSPNCSLYKLCAYLGDAHICGRSWHIQDEIRKVAYEVFTKHLGLVENKNQPTLLRDNEL